METDADIETMFDDISYSKGASVLRMLRAYLTREMNPSPRLRRALQQVRGSPSAPNGYHAQECRATQWCRLLCSLAKSDSLLGAVCVQR